MAAANQPPSTEERERRLPGWLAFLARLQARRPWLLIVIAALTLLPAGLASNQLFHDLRMDFSELLPDNKESVIGMRRVSKRLAGASTLSIALSTSSQGKQKELEACVDALVPELYGLGKDWVGAVDAGVKETRQFFDENAALYAGLDDLKKAHARILERYDWEVSKQQGSLLDEEDEPEAITAESIEKQVAAKKPAASPGNPSFPNGYYENPEGNFIALMIRTPVSSDAKLLELRQRVEQVVERVNPRRFEPSMVAGYTGDAVTRVEETNRVISDLWHVGLGGVLSVMGIVFLYFTRVRVVLTMGGALLVGLLWTFGVTNYTIGYLNSSTGFLVSIVAGNGINYGIVYMARYVEARRDQRLPVADAIRIAHRDTWIPTLASSATGALAYGSLIFTDFRGFKHFGIIGGYGMLFCWLATYLFTPALLSASELVWPAYKENKRALSIGNYFGVLFARIGLGAPRFVTALGAALGLIALVLTGLYFKNDPMEYNMRNVGNDDAITQSAARRLSRQVDKVVGRIGQDGIAIVTDRVDQVQPLEAELERRHAAAPANLKPFDKTVSIFSLLPKDQEQKLPLVTEMNDRIQRARKRGFINDQDWAKLEKRLPKGELKSIGIDDLPEQVARPFTERDGSRGRIVYIAPKTGFSVWDAKYLMRWADTFRHVTLPNGEVIKGSGRAVIFADMIKTIGEDAPRAIMVSALGTILIILIAFRGNRLAWGVFVPWLVGVASLLAFLYLKDIRLNFLNFVAIPITVGIGAEYAHNMMQRYRFEGPGKLRQVVLATGGALTLCSLTTSIGYFALLFSINKGIHSFALSAAVGELVCLAATVLWLPALLAYLEQRRSKNGLARPARA
ncbi:MAG TPA: MMPL family transporter [Polyangiaceae bacterium]|nr:MMPL family transporter [Polyangiaceae bacterium]